MKDRLITLLFALAAFFLSIFLLMPPPAPEDPVSMPTTEDRGAQGLKGLFRWLQVNQIPAVSLKNRYAHLAEGDFPESRNILILSMPQQQKALASEWSALQDWVGRGNTVLVLAAGYYIPKWSQQGDCFCEIKKLLRGFDWDIDSSDQSETENETEAEIDTLSFKQKIERLKQGIETFIPKPTSLEPLSEHTLLHAVTSVQSKISDAFLERQWEIETQNNKLALQLLGLENQNPPPHYVAN